MGVVRPGALLAFCILATAACSPGPPPTSTPTLQPPQEIPDPPARDWFGLAARYTGITANPLTAAQLYPDEPAGTTRTFWTIDLPGRRMFEIEAELRHVGERALWYVERGIAATDEQLQETARFFDEQIYPHVLGTFAPGRELGGRLTIVNARVPGVGGYFSPADALPTQVYPFSNERVAIFVSATGLIGQESYRGTLAHELQHAVHWLVDRTEATWVNEGLSELATRSMGLPALPVDAYLRQPDVALIDWPEEVGESLPHYAGASLLFTYLAQRTGTGNIHLLVAEQEDGLAGIARYLEEVAPGTRFDDLYADWLVANLVGAEHGTSYPGAPGTVTVERTLSGPISIEETVHQLGAWYARIDPDRPLRVTFTGRTLTPLLPVAPHGGESCWWSNRGDSIDSTLTRTLDLTGLDTATLAYWTWYRIEEDWDHGYVSVSTDGGITWAALKGRLTTGNNPFGTAYGPSYTGRSDGWRRDQVDLSPYAGQPMLLRFEYATDESINTVGWCIDDIEVPQVGFSDDAESDGDWQADGFVRATRAGMEQRFVLRLVERVGDGTKVTAVELDEHNSAAFTVDAPAVLVVAAVAPKASERARFTLRLSEERT